MPVVVLESLPKNKKDFHSTATIVIFPVLLSGVVVSKKSVSVSYGILRVGFGSVTVIN